MRWHPLGAVAGLLAVWTGLQLWLAHRAVRTLDAHVMAGYQRMRALSIARARVTGIAPFHGPPPRPNPASIWIHAGEQSLLTAVGLSLVAAALVAGGRRWWAALVVAVPLANAVGGFATITYLGEGWWQETSSAQTWMTVGTFVDAAMLLAVVALLVRALPAPSTPAIGAAGRGVVAAVVMLAWWIARVDTSDPDHRMWVTLAILFVLAAALLATSSLPLALRLMTVILALPVIGMLLTGDALIEGLRRPVFDSTEFVHHALVAVAVLCYAAGVPALVKLALTDRLPRENGHIAHV